MCFGRPLKAAKHKCEKIKVQALLKCFYRFLFSKKFVTCFISNMEIYCAKNQMYLDKPNMYLQKMYHEMNCFKK